MKLNEVTENYIIHNCQNEASLFHVTVAFLLHVGSYRFIQRMMIYEFHSDMMDVESVVPELVGIHIQCMGPREMDLQYFCLWRRNLWYLNLLEFISNTWDHERWICSISIQRGRNLWYLNLLEFISAVSPT